MVYSKLLLELNKYFVRDVSGVILSFYKSPIKNIDKCCEYGDYIMISQLKNINVYWSLYEACRGGYIEIVKLMIERGSTNFKFGLRGACMDGHMEIIKFMIRKYANYDLKYCLRISKMYGQIKVQHYLENLIKTKKNT